MHSDHPTLEDKLDRQALIKAKAQQVTNCQPPQTFGIHGDWGSGKTSFLRQLRYHLDGNTDGCEVKVNRALKKGQYQTKVITIWFDAWRYQHEAAPVIALLQEIRRQFSSWDKLKNKGKKLGTITGRAVLNSLGDITKLLKTEAIPADAKGIQKLGELWEKQNLETQLGVDTIQEFLQQAIETLIGANKKLVIFIDDLDRCSSTAAFRLLEGLKVYLDLNNCVFVLGMNQKIVVDAIANELTLYDNEGAEASLNTIYAEAYLEKLCSNIERLTPPLQSTRLLLMWLDGQYFTDMTDALMDIEGNLVECLPPNPRRIKALANLVNTWLPLLSTAENNYEKIKSYQAIVVVAYVYQFHSELFQRWQYTPAFYKQLNLWATQIRSVDDVLPAYLKCLELPLAIEENSTDPVDPISAISNYPDPYAVNMFWIQPLLREAQLQEDDISAIMAAVTPSGSQSS